MIIIGMATARRRMRAHQGIPPRRTRLPLWRLLLGEAVWACRQLVSEPLVLAAQVLGFAVTLAVLGATAPGPALPLPGRVVVALLVGLALARGTWSWLRRRSGSGSRSRSATRAGNAPGIAATEVVGVLIGVVLLAWLLVWLVRVAT